MSRDKYYAIRFAVEGNSRFPLDMLRYDRCVPASEMDAGTIERYSRGALGTVRVNLVRFSRAGKSDPCMDRWASFGWKVDASSIEYL